MKADRKPAVAMASVAVLLAALLRWIDYFGTAASIVFLFIELVALVGFLLTRSTAQRDADKRSIKRALGVALFSSSLVLLLGFLNQVDQDKRNHRSADLQVRESARQAFKLLLSSTSNLSKADLNHSDLSNMIVLDKNLTNANFTEARLNNSTLDGSDLSFAKLGGANLSSTSVAGATMDDADFAGGDVTATLVKLRGEETLSRKGLVARRVNFANADLSGALLSGTNLAYSRFEKATLTGADLRNANLTGVSIQESTLDQADLSGVSLVNARLKGNFRGVILAGADLTGADLRGADLSKSEMIGAIIDDARTDFTTLLPPGIRNRQIAKEAFTSSKQPSDLRSVNLATGHLRGVDLSNRTMDYADLSNADLRDANLSNTTFYRADLGGADLSGANLSGSKFIESDLSGATAHAVKPVNGFDNNPIFDRANLTDFEIDGLVGPVSAERAIVDRATDFQSAVGELRIDKDVLSNLDLSSVNINGIDLSGRTLIGVSLENATAIGARFDRALILNCNLHGMLGYAASAVATTFAFGTNLDYADLRFTDFSDASLLLGNSTDIDLTGANLNSSHFAGTVAYSKFDNISAQSADFGRLDMGLTPNSRNEKTNSTSGLVYSDGTLFHEDRVPEGSINVDHTFSLHDGSWQRLWLYAAPRSVGLERVATSLLLDRSTDLSEVTIHESSISIEGAGRIGEALVERSRLSGSWFAAADLRGWTFRLVDLRGVDLSGANLEGATIDRVLVDSSTVLPVGFHSPGLIDLAQPQMNTSLEGAKIATSRYDSISLSCVACRLRGADLSAGSYGDSLLARSDLSYSNAGGVNLSRSNMNFTSMVGARLDGAVLNSAHLVSANMSQSSLRGTDLRFANLTGADLTGADLTGANLFGATLAGARYDSATRLPGDLDLAASEMVRVRVSRGSAFVELSRLTLPGEVDRTGRGLSLAGQRFDMDSVEDEDVVSVDASWASLRGINIRSSQLRQSDFSFADLSDSNIESTYIYYSNFRGAKLAGARIVDSVLYGVDLSQVDLSGTEFRNVLALGVRWPGGVLPNGVVGAWEDLSNPGATHARLDHVYFGRVDLSGSSFLYAHLASASLRFASFRDANFTGAILRLADARNADLRGARFDRADLRGVDFRGASLSGASFVNSIVDSTTRVDPGVELIGSVYSDKMSRIRGQVVSFSFDQRSDCSGFRMSGVHQIGSQFSRVDCDRMDLSVGSCLGCSLESSSVASMDVSFGDVSSSNFGESRALTVDLSGAKAQVVTFADFTIGRLVATNADLTGSSLIGVSILDYGDFRGADLRDCRAIAIIMFDGSFSGANLESCDLRGAMLAGVDFRDSSLREADLRGADLRGADLEGADLEGALFDGFTQWPSDDFDWDSRGAHVDVTRWDLVQPSLMRFARLHGQI